MHTFQQLKIAHIAFFFWNIAYINANSCSERMNDCFLIPYGNDGAVFGKKCHPCNNSKILCFVIYCSITGMCQQPRLYRLVVIEAMNDIWQWGRIHWGVASFLVLHSVCWENHCPASTGSTQRSSVTCRPDKFQSLNSVINVKCKRK